VAENRSAFLRSLKKKGFKEEKVAKVGADLREASLRRADLREADLREADLHTADLSEANLSGATLYQASLIGACLLETNFAGADLTGCFVYGISAWNVKLEGTTQLDLAITPRNEPVITVDNLEMAQFIYLLLHNEKIRALSGHGCMCRITPALSTQPA
jgi:hypothetical protein